jgi:type III restriction enzyme
MIINIDAFRKAENIINQAQDKLNGETAMRYIQDTRPIVIIDEPQSVDNTQKARDAIESLNPLCELRYSATHREKINLLYRLTPVDAYQMNLVKQISVLSNQVEGGHNKAYIRLLSTKRDGGFTARLELDVETASGKVERKLVTVKPGANLFVVTGKREIYEGYEVTGIDTTPGAEAIEFSNGEYVRINRPLGGVDEMLIKRAQIKRTIEFHLEKEIRYHSRGIKVLSLFFIDEVANYRAADGSAGIYARMFEECYEELINSPRFAELRDVFPRAGIHDGYFSQDKKGHYKNTKGDSADDFTTYQTIMQKKEWLLSLECPLRFIWSHSALKEGWDNPNVFQVCTLLDQKSAFTARQKIGRGLRLCVNQNGERVEDKNINLLHVVANESFAEFADNLQKEIEAETGLRFGYLQIDMFAGQTYTEQRKVGQTVTPEQAARVVEILKNSGLTGGKGVVAPTATPAIIEEIELPPEIAEAKEAIAAVIEKAGLAYGPYSLLTEAIAGTAYTATVSEEKTFSYEQAAGLMEICEEKGYTKKGKIQDKMREAIKDHTLDLGHYNNTLERFGAIVRSADTKPPLTDASRNVTVRLKKNYELSPVFSALWEKISQKTTYRVKIDTETLVARAVKSFREMDKLPEMRLVSKTADFAIHNMGVSHTEREIRTTNLLDDYTFEPNLAAIAAEQCLIKRETVLRILEESGRVDDFLRNPQLFSERFSEIIKYHRHELAIDGISYIKLNGEYYYAQEIFGLDELIGNLDKNAVPVNNSLYDHIIYDSPTVEKPFALALDKDPRVKMFFKLPRYFKINTPIGSYNPDWAVYLEEDGDKKLYLVLETKGAAELYIAPSERLKYHCGKAHFKAIDPAIETKMVTKWSEVMV